MLKNLISPVQAWLLSQGKCVGCSMPLAKGKKDALPAGRQGNKVTCKCKRIYIEENGKFRRAKLEEV